MSPFDSQATAMQNRQAARPPFPPARRAALIQDVAISLLVPAIAERFLEPTGLWRGQAATLSRTLTEMPLSEAVESLAALNPAGRRFEQVCRDILLPAALRLRRRYDERSFDQSGRSARVWQLRMCLLSLDDAGPRPRLPLSGLHSALALSGTPGLPSVEHGIATRFLGRAGWDVSDCCCDDAEDACESAQGRDFDVAWISLEPRMAVAEIRQTARDLRRASRNAGILVLGGGVSRLRPADPAELDLDGYTGSAVEAAMIAEAALRGRGTGLPAR